MKFAELRESLVPLRPCLKTIIGVYFLSQDGDVVYVGQSIDCLSRIGIHSDEKKKQFDEAYVLPVPADMLDVVETCFIKSLQPIYNGRSTKTIRDYEYKDEISDLARSFIKEYGGKAVSVYTGSRTRWSA